MNEEECIIGEDCCCASISEKEREIMKIQDFLTNEDRIRKAETLNIYLENVIRDKNSRIAYLEYQENKLEIENKSLIEKISKYSMLKEVSE